MKRTFLAIGTVAVVTLGSTILVDSPAVHAEPSLQDVNSKQDTVKSKLSKAESQIADILYEIKEANEEITRLNAALKENKAEIDKNKKEIKTIQVEIDELNEKIEVRNEILKNRISSFQENGGNINYLDVFLGSKDFTEFISRMSAVTTISNADADLIKENEEDKEVVKEKLTVLEDLASELKDQKSTIDTQKEQKSKSKKELENKEAKVKEKKAKLEKESSELAALESQIRASIVSPATTQVASATTGNSNASASNTTASKSSSKKKDKTVAYTGGGGSAIAAGKQFIGKTSYSYGAQNPSAGLFDCSGFVQWAYAQEGVSLPRTASAMSRVGSSVPYSQAQPGDLVIFRGGGHVGIYLGGGMFLGSQTSTGVAIANMNSGYWKNNFDGIVRRVK